MCLSVGPAGAVAVGDPSTPCEPMSDAAAAADRMAAELLADEVSASTGKQGGAGGGGKKGKGGGKSGKTKASKKK